VYEGINNIGIDPHKLFSSQDNTQNTVGGVAPSSDDLNEIRKRNGFRKELIGPNVITLCKLADVVFLALHGDMGENGQLQATLDVFDIKYTGSGYKGSLLAMDKHIAKQLMRQNEILTPDWIRFDIGSGNEKIDEAIEKIGFPCIVKPCSCGSSVGVSLVDNVEALKTALRNASDYESSVLIEKRIFGREITQAFIDGKALPPVEIIPKSGFYDYANKYIANATEEICPAPISQKMLDKVNTITEKCFEALCLADYARIDYIIDENEDFWCLEANTLPGMTPTSLMPQEAAAVGISYDDLCEKLVLMALAKKQKEEQK